MTERILIVGSRSSMELRLWLSDIKVVLLLLSTPELRLGAISVGFELGFIGVCRR